MGGFSGEEFDSFWDLSSMLSRKKKKTVEPDTDTSKYNSGEEIALPAVVSPTDDITAQTNRDDTHTLHITRPGEACSMSYTPSASALITEVKLYKRPNAYSFYSQFREDAIRYLSVKGEACEPEPFFSYIPQYAQMNHRQLAFYFYWRECAKSGKYLPSDISYFWLYVYEIINLPDYIPPNEGVKALCLAWSVYRNQYPRIDKYMTVWLADYCLVNALDCPYEHICEFLPAILENAGFKEFYLGHITDVDELGVYTILSLVSNYAWQKSKFVASLSEEDKHHLMCSLVDVVKQAYQTKDLMSQSGHISVLSRDAFSGSLCAHNIKCRIEATYHSFSHTPKMAEALTAALKYAENKLRAIRGQKSRLMVGDGLIDEHKAFIDHYFQQAFPPASSQAKVVPRPEYEKLYEAEQRGLSLEDAMCIEDRSWQNTQKLIEEESEPAICLVQDTDLDVVDESISVSEEPISPVDLDIKEELSESEYALLVSLLSHAINHPSFEILSMCETLNDRFVEILGDIVIDLGEDTCSILEDYREDIESWLSQNQPKM